MSGWIKLHEIKEILFLKKKKVSKFEAWIDMFLRQITKQKNFWVMN